LASPPIGIKLGCRRSSIGSSSRCSSSKSSLNPTAMVTIFAIAEYLTIFLGTVLGLVQGCFGGFAKLVPCGLMGVKMSKGFTRVYGPFLGFPGTFLRIIIGLGETSAGICIMLGVWGDALDLFDEDCRNLVRALCIVAGSALMVVGFVAGMMHYYVDAKLCSPPAVLGCIALIFTLTRIFAVEPRSVNAQWLATWLTSLVMVMAIVAMIVNHFFGQHESLVREANAELNAL